jgi:hypothetical protein
MNVAQVEVSDVFLVQVPQTVVIFFFFGQLSNCQLFKNFALCSY